MLDDPMSKYYLCCRWRHDGKCDSPDMRFEETEKTR